MKLIDKILYWKVEDATKWRNTYTWDCSILNKGSIQNNLSHILNSTHNNIQIRQIFKNAESWHSR